MKQMLNDLHSLFEEAKEKNEFDFVLTLINYSGIAEKELSTNLHEWFEAIEFYDRLFNSLKGKEKARIGLLFYSTFFENSDFYNVIGSLCKNKLGFKGSSYLFWKTKKYDRLLGVGEKQDYLMELLNDADKPNLISFFEETHFKEIRNTFFHSAYSLSDKEYILHDSDPIRINGVGQSTFVYEEFLYPKIATITALFYTFRDLYLGSFRSYTKDKIVDGYFPNPVKVTILGSENGLKGFRIKNAVQLYGSWHDSGIWYDKKNQFWTGHNIQFHILNKETIEIREQISRYEKKPDIVKSDSEFHNMVEKIAERNQPAEIVRIVVLLVRFGDKRYEKMQQEKNPFKRDSYPKYILPFYIKAIELGNRYIDTSEIEKKIKHLEILIKSTE